MKVARSGGRSAWSVGVVAAAAGVLLVLGGPAEVRAKSIFDDDWKPPARNEPAPVYRPAAPPEVPAGATAKPPVTRPAAQGEQPVAVPPEPPTPASRPARLKVPVAADQARSRELMRQLYAAVLDDRSAAVRRRLGPMFRAEADKVRDNATDRYVLLVGALRAAQESGDVATAVGACDALAADYEVDATAVKGEIARSVVAPAPDAGKPAADALAAGTRLVDDLVAAEDFAGAAKLLATLQPLAAADPAARAGLQRRAKDVAALREARERLDQASQRLRAAPNDPAALVVVGSYYCFARGDWPGGLPMLATGGDAALAAAAREELTNPATPDARKAAGDRWWGLAEAQPPRPDAAAARQRAAHSYRLAAPGLTGLSRALAQKRADAVVAAEPPKAGPTPAPGAPPAAANRTVNLLAMVDPSKDVVGGNWSVANGVLAVADSEFARLQLPYVAPSEYDLTATFTYTTKGGPVILLCPLGDGGGSVMWVMEFNKLGFEADGKLFARGEGKIERDKQHTAVVRVRKALVQAYLDGRLVAEFQPGDQKRRASGPWRIKDESRPGLAVWHSDATFTRVEVLEVGGRGRAGR